MALLVKLWSKCEDRRARHGTLYHVPGYDCVRHTVRILDGRTIGAMVRDFMAYYRAYLAQVSETMATFSPHGICERLLLGCNEEHERGRQ